MSVRCLVLGAAGQVGQALEASLPAQIDFVPSGPAEVDVRDGAALSRALGRTRASVVVNCAAWTAVDDAEAHADEANAVNGTALTALGTAARASGARVIHISTDYVFDGEGGAPYGTGASPNPLSVYGASKLEGERRLAEAAPDSVILRTSWIHSSHGTSFVRTAVRLLLDGEAMKVVDDQIGTPTRAAHLARAVWAIVERPSLSGTLHFTDAGVASWYDVATAVLEALVDAECAREGAAVVPASSDSFPRPARRPRVSVLDKHASWAAIGWTPPHWRSGVFRTVREILDA